MHNKHRKNLRPFLSQDVDAKDVLSSHAYGRVARGSSSIPSRPASSRHHKAVRAYNDSMVGSLAQYREKVPERPKAPEATASTATDTPIIGNRPQHGASENGKVGGNSIERRHHFIEPPKRGFNRFG